MLKTLQLQLTQLDIRNNAKQRLHSTLVPGLDECHRSLGRQEHLQGPCIRCKPVLDLSAHGGITPIAGQDESLAVGG
ncbi:hypothetical protein SDC9_66067 [bioreactor metagenome]|uniref:Uncharacterized protein n=1 Tax=bioreactor metagenome TaxID=1076179 RepID=A0A644XV82_9ZZZZ